MELIFCASVWGYPFEKDDVKNLVKSYLDHMGQTFKTFKNILMVTNGINIF